MRGERLMEGFILDLRALYGRRFQPIAWVEGEPENQFWVGQNQGAKQFRVKTIAVIRIYAKNSLNSTPVKKN
jgi:hypothetical protein